MHWMILPLKRYFDFKGRSRRKEFWLWTLFVIIVTVVLSIVDAALGLGGSTAVDTGATPDGLGYNYGAGFSGGLLANVFSLAVLIPNIAVGVRRLHDIDRTGWWMLLPVPFYLVGAVILAIGAINGEAGQAMIGMIAFVLGFVCAIVLLVFYCLDGTSGPNRFGPDPKDPHGEMDVEEVFS